MSNIDTSLVVYHGHNNTQRKFTANNQLIFASDQILNITWAI